MGLIYNLVKCIVPHLFSQFISPTQFYIFQDGRAFKWQAYKSELNTFEKMFLKSSKTYVEWPVVSKNGVSIFHLIPSVDGNENSWAMKDKKQQVDWEESQQWRKTYSAMNFLHFYLHFFIESHSFKFKYSLGTPEITKKIKMNMLRPPEWGEV